MLIKGHNGKITARFSKPLYFAYVYYFFLPPILPQMIHTKTPETKKRAYEIAFRGGLDEECWGAYDLLPNQLLEEQLPWGKNGNRAVLGVKEK
jgi:hypothetical protein